MGRTMKRILAWVLATGLSAAIAAPAAGAPIELTAPDGRTVILYDDFTWEFKRAPPNLTSDTVELDDLVTRPSQYLNQDVVVTGPVTRLLGAYRLTTDKSQNNMVVDVEQVRRADQIKLEQALESVGFTGSVRVQIQGNVEQGTVTHRLVARNIVIIDQ